MDLSQYLYYKLLQEHALLLVLQGFPTQQQSAEGHYRLY